MSDSPANSPQREKALDWLERQGIPAESIAGLAGDVSLRQYARVTLAGSTAILATYPPEIYSACQKFLQTTQLLSQAQVRVPGILACDCDQGLMVVEDVGSRSLYDIQELTTRELSSYFWRATDDLPRIQSISNTTVAALNLPLQRDLLWQELSQTWSTFFEPQGLVTDQAFSRDLQKALLELCDRLSCEAPVPCHRDFMVRNLIPIEPEPDLVVLDHQDLRLGPKYYDLASLLNDSLFPPGDVEEDILQHFLGDDSVERTHYFRAAAQRTLKAIGTYEKFAQRGFPRHRKLIPETLTRALRHLDRIPETASVSGQLEKRMASLVIC